MSETDPRRPRRFADERGIALQTVIIMVVLLAIAGGIAAVLLSRGGEAANQLEQQEVIVAPNSYTNRALCVAAGNEWVADGAETPVKVDDDGHESTASGAAKANGPTCYKSA